MERVGVADGIIVDNYYSRNISWISAGNRTLDIFKFAFSNMRTRLNLLIEK